MPSMRQACIRSCWQSAVNATYPTNRRRQPRELLTQANAILGQGQMSLSKYLWIVDRQDDPTLDVADVSMFFQHVLARVDWRRDLHFQTCTTIDTLDYSGTALNEGSKVIIAAAGPSIRSLPTQIPADLHLPDGFHSPRVCLPGVLAVQGPAYQTCRGGSAARASARNRPWSRRSIGSRGW